MTEAQELKAQLVAVWRLAQLVDNESDPIQRRHALERMHAGIKGAEPILRSYAVDLMVELPD